MMMGIDGKTIFSSSESPSSPDWWNSSRLNSLLALETFWYVWSWLCQSLQRQKMIIYEFLKETTDTPQWTKLCKNLFHRPLHLPFEIGLSHLHCFDEGEITVMMVKMRRIIGRALTHLSRRLPSFPWGAALPGTNLSWPPFHHHQPHHHHNNININIIAINLLFIWSTIC